LAWSCTDGKIATAVMNQEPSISKTLSPHKTKVGLYKLGADGTLANTDRIDVAYEKALTKVTDLIGKACPDFVYPNVGDEDYALFSLDQTSLKLAPKVLAGGSSDALLRLMVWNTLHQMLRDRKLTPDAYFQATIPAFETEKNSSVLGPLLGRHSDFRNNYNLYQTPEQRAVLAPKLEETIWKRATTEEAGSSAQMSFFDFYVQIAQTPAGIKRLQGFLNGTELPRGFKLDQDRR
ncbi:MAG: ERAP1-like C-terminal domain-containing protein, partial [Bdellovibrionota bacterium]